MRVRKQGCPSKRKKCRLILMLCVCMLLILAVGAAGFGLTGEKTQKAQKTNAEKLQVKNEGCDQMETNPLRSEEEPKINEVIIKYYKELAVKTDFIDSYENIKVYTKDGQYQNTYVAFVTYGMKIRDIYTEVPGLSTLYLEKNGTSGEYQIDTEELDDRTEAYIEALAKHEDVQTLMEESRNEYQQAVQSDALLQEALLDLQNAYEDSTGS